MQKPSTRPVGLPCASCVWNCSRAGAAAAGAGTGTGAAASLSTSFVRGLLSMAARDTWSWARRGPGPAARCLLRGHRCRFLRNGALETVCSVECAHLT
uniref:Uncharacterized protein n=1 Tax=Falco tinnunculus TaxID=100819 RepID=A0A8C4V9G4_FALTI